MEGKKVEENWGGEAELEEALGTGGEGRSQQGSWGSVPALASLSLPAPSPAALQPLTLFPIHVLWLLFHSF